MNMVMMYGGPPDFPSERFKPQEPGKEGIGPVQHPMPSAQAMPPITHNPFTGEPVNVLEMLAQNALLIDEKKRLMALCEEQLKQVNQLKVQASGDAHSIATLESKLIDLETRYNALARLKSRTELGAHCAFVGGCLNKPMKNLTMCRKHQPFPAKKR
jgi:hypothetical protein